jgi:hypothetical protein
VAYERLTPTVRAKVDMLIKLNPEYANWVGSYPARNAAQYAFVRASVWDDWFTESEKLAEANAYAEPVKSGTQPYMLDRQYETNARNIARQQAALAGARLANLINEALK